MSLMDLLYLAFYLKKYRSKAARKSSKQHALKGDKLQSYIRKYSKKYLQANISIYSNRSRRPYASCQNNSNNLPPYDKCARSRIYWRPNLSIYTYLYVYKTRVYHVHITK